MANVRESNLEALRIVAMLLVIILHCTFRANGFMIWCNFTESPGQSFLYTFVGALSLVCVDTFVLISGYFGIRPKFKSFCNLMFIVYFYRYSIYFVNAICTGSGVSLKELVLLANPFGWDWFISVYIGLYLFAYLLNVFIDNVSKAQFRGFLTIYLIAMAVLGWIMPGSFSPGFNFGQGYSVYSFVGLYLIGRYVRLYINKEEVSKKRSLFIYLCSCAVNALAFILLSSVAFTESQLTMLCDWFISYDSMFTLVASVALVLLFRRFNLSSKFVNWLAVSALSVYLIHVNANVFPLFLYGARWIRAEFWTWAWLPIVLLYSVSVYMMCVLIDQMRIMLWNVLYRLYSRMLLIAHGTSK